MNTRSANFAVTDNHEIIAIFHDREMAYQALEVLGVSRPTDDPKDVRRMEQERYRVHGVHSTARIGDDARTHWADNLPASVRGAWLAIFRAEEPDDTDPGWG